jgi:hypothetical protein
VHVVIETADDHIRSSYRSVLPVVSASSKYCTLYVLNSKARGGRGRTPLTGSKANNWGGWGEGLRLIALGGGWVGCSPNMVLSKELKL